MSWRDTIFILIALAIGGASGYLLRGGVHGIFPEGARDNVERPPVAARLVKVQEVDAAEFNEFAGTVQSRKVVQVSAQIVARIQEIAVRSNDRVKAGQVLVVLDDEEVRARVRQAEEAALAAEAAVKAAEAGVASAQAAVKQAELELARQKATYEAGATPKAALDQAETAYRTAMAALDGAREQVNGASRNREAAVKQVEAVRVLLSYTKILSPMDGVVVDKYAEVGDLASPGRPLMTLQSDTDLRFEAPVSESCARMIKVGMPAIVRIDAVGRSWETVTQEIVPAMDPSSRSFLVRAHLPDPSALKPGMFGRLRFACAPSKALAVPADAVLHRGQLDLVFVVSGGRARLRLVKIGRTIGDRVEVLSGLSVGEEVVAGRSESLRDGDAVVAEAEGNK